MNGSLVKINHPTKPYYLSIVRSITLVTAVLFFSGCAISPEAPPIQHSSRSSNGYYSPRSSRPHYSPRTSHPSYPSIDVTNYALSLDGAPYRYGKSSPTEGFDCSGFVHHVYKHHGIILPRSARDMAAELSPVSKNQMTSGDLVFFNTNGGANSHVGIYLNDDEFIHATSSRTGRVMISNLNSPYWKKHFCGVRRP